jgi:hypothetical protein
MFDRTQTVEYGQQKDQWQQEFASPRTSDQLRATTSAGQYHVAQQMPQSAKQSITPDSKAPVCAAGPKFIMRNDR